MKLPAFTLIELLLAVSLISVIGSFSAFQSINSFQRIVQKTHEIQDVLVQEARAGMLYRHSINRDADDL